MNIIVLSLHVEIGILAYVHESLFSREVLVARQVQHPLHKKQNQKHDQAVLSLERIPIRSSKIDIIGFVILPKKVVPSKSEHKNPYLIHVETMQVFCKIFDLILCKFYMIRRGAHPP